ncbi:MAG: glycoside hydrolase family 13 protein [Eubacteriales bacterium]|nr:glycoside hydrolase family 13 protein [Eubacteriales bacterium]
MSYIPDCIFRSRDAGCKSPYGAVPAGQGVTFSTYPKRERGAAHITLWVEEDGGTPVAVPMRWYGLAGSRDQYRAVFTPEKPGLYWYYFTADMPDGLLYCCRGYGGRAELLDTLGDKYQLTVYDPAYHPPRWFGEGITYNIFPDRFCRDRLPVQPEGEGIAPRVLHADWNDVPVYQPNEHGEILNNDFFGGTLRGVIDKLDYLESLRVTTIYFNPIFQAYSNHRYDTGDYRRIDPLLGDEADLRALCDEAARRGMRVVLDGVFNHTGFDSRYFNGRGRYDSVGAHQSEQSPYRSWFDFQHWPDKYGAWWGIYTLPQVNERDESYQRFIFGDPDSVVRHWLRLGVSGWRLDVADELPDDFIRSLNDAAKQEKPDALIIGEVWEDASNKIAYSERRAYFQGGELDSVMNYPLRDAILAYLNGGTAEHFAETMECIRENYPRDVFYNLMNVIGTHDTARALTMLGVGEEEWRMDKAHKAQYVLPPARLAAARRRLKLAAVIQFTMPGSPTIYYGDEAGRQGFEDPFNRCTYPWGAEDRELLSFYRRLCAFRADSDTLARGELRFVACAGALLQYIRTSDHARLLVLVNRGHHAVQTEVDAVYAVDMLTDESFDQSDSHGLHVSVPPETAYILRCFGTRDKGGK